MLQQKKSYTNKVFNLPAILIERCTHALSHVGAPLSVVLCVVGPDVDPMAPHLVLLHVAAVVAAVFICNLARTCAYEY